MSEQNATDSKRHTHHCLFFLSEEHTVSAPSSDEMRDLFILW